MGMVPTVLLRRMSYGAGLDECDDLINGGIRNGILTDYGDRRRLAAADTRRVQHADVAAEHCRKFRQELARTRQVTRDRIADTDGDWGRSRFSFLDDVEMMIEGRDFVHFGHRHLHRVG